MNVLMTGFQVQPQGIGEYYGFEIDGDHRYLMADFTVTHNSGKSVLLALMVAQWFRYPGAQAFPFDVDLSMRCLTLCLGGLHYDVGRGTVRVQPYRHIDDPLERGWAYQWTLDRLKEANIAQDDDSRWAIGEALERLQRATLPQRTITELVVVLSEMLRTAEAGSRNRHLPHATRLRALTKVLSAIIRTLTLFTTGQVYGLLDASEDDLNRMVARLITFEMRSLLAQPALIHPMLSAIFHRLEGRFDTRTPTLLPMDEFAVLAAIPDIAKQGKEWLMTRAKKNVSLGLATHSIAQIFGDADNVLGALMLEGCATTFAMPNAAARTPHMAAIYRRLGFNNAEIEAISSARPQRDVYYAADIPDEGHGGKRMFSLQLSPVLLAMLARNRAEDHEAMDAILAEHGPEDFLVPWLEAQGYPKHAARVRRGTPIEEALA